MDHQTRLFQMLQSSAPAPGHGTQPGTQASHTLPIPPTHPGAPVQQHPSHPGPPTAGLLSPPGQTPTSPREPSPSPPPPSLQAVSLSDLFKNLQLPVGSPAVSTPGASQANQSVQASAGTATGTGPGASVSPPAQGTTPDQRSRLLGMLTGLGSANSGVGPTNMPGAAGLTPQGSAMTTHHTTPPSSPTPPTPHPAPALPPTTTPLPLPVRGTPPIAPLQSTATGTSTTSASSLQKPDGALPGSGPGSAAGSVAGGAAAKSPDPPKRGRFDFVSPFDFFEKPSPQGSSVGSPVVAAETKLPSVAAVNPAPAARTQAQAPAPVPAPEQKQIKQEQKQIKQEQKQSPAQPELTKVKSIEKTLGGRGVSSQATQTQSQGQRGASPAVSDVPARAGDEAQAPTWLVDNVTKGAQGKGPKTTPSHIAIDLSKPNLDALVSSRGLVQVTPTTFMKADSVGYRKGRKVAMTQAYVAYTVPKGKIRVIDNASGARLLLQAQAKAEEGPILDLAVSGSLIAAIAHDLSLWVWRVPQYWEGDDPEVETVFSGATAGGPLGKAFKVEWVKKDGRQFVAVAGQEGVVVFDPAEHARGGGFKSVAEVFAGLQVLKTDGAVVDVCLNQSHQAMGILSSSSYFTLFSIANLNRVWHRLLPSASPHSPPSSAQFLESNIIIGRAQNTHYDIVQITVDLAVLSSIKFLAPPPCPAELHYTNASYDGSKGILWIAPFARGSLYAFRYALKDQQPIKDVSLPHGPKVVAFDRVAEFPVAAVSSLAVCRKEVGEAPEVFFATPKGFSSATVSLEALELLKGGSASGAVPAPAPAAIPTPLPTVIPAQQPAPTPAQAPTPQKPATKNLKSTPVKVKSELPSDDESVAASVVGKGKKGVRNGSVAAGAGAVPAVPAAQEQAAVDNGLTGEDLLKALKKTEDRLQNQFKQLLKNETTVLNARFDSLAGPALANDITARVEKSVKASLAATVSAEIKKTVLPAAATAIQSELRAITSASIPTAIDEALQTLPKDLERGLAPVVQRTVATMVQNSMERVVHESIQLSLAPALNNATAALSDRFMDELKSEMLQIRKELSPPRVEAQLSNEHMLKTMAVSIAEMQKQLVSLNEQVAKSAAAAAAPPAHPNGVAQPAVPPAVPAHPNQAPPPQQQQPFYPPPPSPAQLQDTFLAALGVQTVPATLQLVNDHSGMTEYCLPVGQGAKSPLSQAVLLTLLHRLATALNELPPSHPLFGRVADWERRSIALIDPKDVNISGYTTRVLGVVQSLVGQVLNALQTRFAADPASQGHAVVLKQVADIVAYKMTL
ncbi:hypothetical protein IAT38_006892 [Cryptococcus sp. DSM 104549]